MARERSAKPLCSGSNPLAASNEASGSRVSGSIFLLVKIFFLECLDVKSVKAAVVKEVFPQCSILVLYYQRQKMVEIKRLFSEV